MTKVTFESTPNPATIKFLLHQTVADTAFDAANATEAERSPLAAKIFGFPWTAGVYVGPDFVTVTKHDWVDWNVLATPLAGLIQEHLERGEPVLLDASQMPSNEADENDSPLVRRIKDALNREIRPVVALDGGDVVFDSFENGVLTLQMKGAAQVAPRAPRLLSRASRCA